LLTDGSRNGSVAAVPPGRPRDFDPNDVLERAMSAFWKLGYDATGIAELERATGLGRQSLYGAFGDKRALFERVLEHYFERVLKPSVIDVLDAPGSGRKNLERLFELWEQAALAPGFNGCLVGNSVSELGLRDAELAHALGRKFELLEAALLRALVRARRAGEVSPRLPLRATARSLLTTSQGLAVMARVRRERGFVRGIIQQAQKLLDA
jgi:TetR/AcrR family transcriptional repressor of nem operon